MNLKIIMNEEAQEILRQFSEGKSNVHTFLTAVAKADDTTKVGNLDKDELGMPTLPVRTYKELGVFCNEIADETEWSDYFDKMSEVQLATSLSKEGFLIKAAITTKKELADMTPKKKNKGWFSKKEEPTQQPIQ